MRERVSVLRLLENCSGAKERVKIVEYVGKLERYGIFEGAWKKTVDAIVAQSK